MKAILPSSLDDEEIQLMMLHQLFQSGTGRLMVYRPLTLKDGNAWKPYTAAERLIDLKFAAWDLHQGAATLRITGQGVTYLKANLDRVKEIEKEHYTHDDSNERPDWQYDAARRQAIREERQTNLQHMVDVGSDDIDFDNMEG